MKHLTTVALASALAVTTVAATATTAAADGRHYRHHYSGSNPAAAVAAGAILGLAFTALTAPRYVAPPPGPYYAYPPYPPPPGPYYAYPQYPPPPPVYRPRLADTHIAWCTSRYGVWYNAHTNTWTDHYGRTHICVATHRAGF